MSESLSVLLRCEDGQVTQSLPGICISCGKPTLRTKRWTFTWQPKSYRLLGLFGAGFEFLGSHEAIAQVPVCDEHHRAMSTDKTLRVLSMILLAAAIPISLGITAISVRNEAIPDINFGLLGIALLVLSLSPALVANARRAKQPIVRALLIDETGITLAGVSPEFHDAVKRTDAFTGSTA